MTNITTLLFQGEYSPTNQCFEWYKEQNFIHATNLQIQGLTILVIALIVLFIYALYLNIGDILDTTHEQKVIIEKIIQLLPEFAMYLMIGFFIWYLYFQ